MEPITIYFSLSAFRVLMVLAIGAMGVMAVSLAAILIHDFTKKQLW